MTQREQVAITSRVFCLAAILGLALVARNGIAIQAVVVVAVVGAMSAYVSYVIGRTTLVTLTAETLVVGVITGLTFPDSVVLLPYLVVIPLLAGLFRGFPGVAIMMLAQIASIVVFPLLSLGLDGFSDRTILLAPWILTNFGGGLLGVWARSLGISPGDDQNVGHYESARQLLTQLRTVTRRLSAGLDSDGMAAQLMATLHEQLDDSYAAVFVEDAGIGAGAARLPRPRRPAAAAAQRPDGRAVLGRDGAGRRRRPLRQPGGPAPGGPAAAGREPDDRRRGLLLGDGRCPRACWPR